MNSKRVYRQEDGGLRLTYFSVKVKDTDLWIAVNSESYKDDLPACTEQVVWNQRRRLEAYLTANSYLFAALEPCLLESDSPEIIRVMAGSANRAGVGPMAAVAGAFAEAVGKYLQNFSPEVVVENGGDIYIKAIEPVNVGIYAGKSPLSGKLALKVDPDQTPLGVCTSSGTIGPSLSLGQADAAVVLSSSTPLADAAATALGNRVRDASDLEPALKYIQTIEGISGALLIYQDKIAAWGAIELIRI